MKTLTGWAPTALLCFAIFYFAGHALTGEKGVIAWMGYKARIADLESEIERTSADVRALEERAARLREATLDLDYLEERARILVGVADPRDIIVPASALPQDVDARRGRR
jgi:cell division protein FtsB